MSREPQVRIIQELGRPEREPLAAQLCLSPIDTWLSKLQLVIRRNYYADFRLPESSPARLSAEDYFRSDEEGLGKGHLCPEMPLPGSFASSVSLSLSKGAAWSEAAAVLVHAGNPGCISPVHFDWDHSWVIHACMSGRKRLFFLPPEAGWLLQPIVNTSSLCLPSFSETDRQDVLKRLGGTEVELHAGEAIVFPSVYWHGVLYEEASLGLSIRVERQPGGRPFAVLPRSWWLQRLAWEFCKNGYGPESLAFLDRCLQLFFSPCDDWHLRYRRMAEFYRQELLVRGHGAGAAHLIGENFETELILAEHELRSQYLEVPQDESDAPSEEVEETLDYLFKGIPKPWPQCARLLAIYALRQRRGLQPRRGLVPIGRIPQTT